MKFDLPYPPSVNSIYSTNRFGGIYLNDQGKDYYIKVAKLMADMKIKPLSGPLKLKVYAFPKTRRRRDCDNILKCTMDSMTKGGAYYDDSQVKELKVIMMPPDKENPRIEITLEDSKYPNYEN